MTNTTWYPLLSTKIGGGGVLFGWDKYAQGVPSGHDFGVVGCLGAFWKKGRLLAYVPPLGTLAPPGLSSITYGNIIKKALLMALHFKPSYSYV